MNPLAIQRINVRQGALDLEVSASLDALHVSEEQATRILDLLPNLAHHVCVNGAGNGTFGDELVGTELPHLLEHLIIELQGQACRTSDGKAAPDFTGHTSWLEELEATSPHGYALMRVTVTFADDFVALSAMNAAIDVIRWMVDPEVEETPDIEEIIILVAGE